MVLDVHYNSLFLSAIFLWPRARFNKSVTSPLQIAWKVYFFVNLGNKHFVMHSMVCIIFHQWVRYVNRAILIIAFSLRWQNFLSASPWGLEKKFMFNRYTIFGAVKSQFLSKKDREESRPLVGLYFHLSARTLFFFIGHNFKTHGLFHL